MNIWILALENVETRYTCEWFYSIPESIKNKLNEINKSATVSTNFISITPVDHNIITLTGNIDKHETTNGAFLNFASTNMWKSSQLEKLAGYFSRGDIIDGDQFLITDAWNPCILQLKYMIDLLGYQNCKIHAIWHAGQYDPYDFLGRCLPDRTWAKETEKSLFYAIDYNYFATEFHVELFKKNVFDNLLPDELNNKICLSGQPHEYMVETISKFSHMTKENIVVFPHRVAPEKNTDMFRHLSNKLVDYEFIVCQDQKLSKPQYHEIMGKSKIMFSASMQETLGIGAMEAILVNCVPLVPDRLSYSEMYINFFKYPSQWTESWDLFIANLDNITELIREKISNYNSKETKHAIKQQKEILLDNYLTADNMYNKIMYKLEPQ